MGRLPAGISPGFFRPGRRNYSSLSKLVRTGTKYAVEVLSGGCRSRGRAALVEGICCHRNVCAAALKKGENMTTRISIFLMLSAMAAGGQAADLQFSVNEATVNEILGMYIWDERLPQDDEGDLAGARFDYSLDIDFVESEQDSTMLLLTLDVSARAVLEHLGEITDFYFTDRIQAEYYVYFDGFHFLVHPFNTSLTGPEIPEWCRFCILDLLTETLRGVPVDLVETCFPVDTGATAAGTGYDIWFENPYVDFEKSPEGAETSFDMFVRLDFEISDFDFHHVIETSASVTYNPVIKDETLVAEFVGADIDGTDIPLWLVLITEEFLETELTEIPLYEGTLLEFDHSDQTVDIEFEANPVSLEVTDERIGVNAWIYTAGTAPWFELQVELHSSGDYILNSVTCNIESDLRISIYNLLGSLVKEYSDRIYPGENYDMFYVGDLGSGVYEYRNHYCNGRKTYPAPETKVIIVQ